MAVVASPRARAVAVQAGVLLALMCLVYMAAVGWPAGREIDDAGRPDEEDGTFWRLLLSIAVYSLREPTFLLAGAVALLLAHRYRSRRLVLAVAAMIVGPSLTAKVLEHLLLGGIDPLGGERERVLGTGFYPSGHATAAMSLAVAVVLIAPAAWQRRAGALAASYAAAVGIGLVAVDSHTPSDIVGGYLLTAAWGTAMVAFAFPHARPVDAGARLAPALAPVAGLVAGLALLAAATLDPPGAGAPAFAAGSAVLTATAFGLVALLQLRR